MRQLTQQRREAVLILLASRHLGALALESSSTRYHA